VIPAPLRFGPLFARSLGETPSSSTRSGLNPPRQTQLCPLCIRARLQSCCGTPIKTRRDLQAAEKLHPAGTKRQGTTSVVPIKPIKWVKGFSPCYSHSGYSFEFSPFFAACLSSKRRKTPNRSSSRCRSRFSYTNQYPAALQIIAQRRRKMERWRIVGRSVSGRQLSKHRLSALPKPVCYPPPPMFCFVTSLAHDSGEW
jgi:hypothetical protein